MSFDTKAFTKAQFTPREGELRLPALAPFFDEGEEPVFRVRMLDALELHNCRADSMRGKLMAEVVGKLAAGSDKEKAQAILDGLGIADDDPPELAQIYSHVEHGLLEPQLTRHQIIRLGQAFPIELNLINRKILELTGQGAVAQVKR